MLRSGHPVVELIYDILLNYPLPLDLTSVRTLWSNFASRSSHFSRSPSEASLRLGPSPAGMPAAAVARTGSAGRDVSDSERGPARARAYREGVAAAAAKKKSNIMKSKKKKRNMKKKKTEKK